MFGKIAGKLLHKGGGAKGAAGRAVDVRVDVGALKDFADEFRRRQNASFAGVESSLDKRTVRISRFFYDNENDILDVFGRIGAETKVSSSGGGASAPRPAFAAVVPSVCLSAAIYFLLRAGGKEVFAPLVLSVLALVSVLVFAAFAAGGRRGTGEKLSVTLRIAIPDAERKRFFDEDCARIDEKIREQTEILDSLVNRPSNGDEAVVDSLSEIYCGLWEMTVLDKYSNVSGCIVPQCEVLLREMGLDAVCDFDDGTARMFETVDSGGAKSFVLSPAVVRKSDGRVIRAGRYVRGGR